MGLVQNSSLENHPIHRFDIRQTHCAGKSCHLYSYTVVSGSLQTRNWTDKDGNKRKAVEIVADSLYFADSKKDGGAAKHAEPARGTAPYAASSLPSVSADDFEAIDTGDSLLPF